MSSHSSTSDDKIVADALNKSSEMSLPVNGNDFEYVTSGPKFELNEKSLSRSFVTSPSTADVNFVVSDSTE